MVEDKNKPVGSRRIKTPLTDEVIRELVAGDALELSGSIFTGRDVALPKLVQLIQQGRLHELNVDLQGSVIFHTAVSPAGVGPTSSNKFDI